MEKDYKKLYEDALETAKAYYKQNKGVVDGVECLSIIFPELKESDDERIRKWLKEMVELVRKANPDNVDHNGMCSEALDWLEKQGKQNNLAWSEADEKQARQIKRIVHDAGCAKKLQEQIADWLKTLKDRVQPQPKWSEEDETKLRTAQTFIRNTSLIEVEGIKEATIDWLKSLKDRVVPQSTWKPTEEQMEAVRIAAEIGTANNSWAMGVLKSMYQDLTKLKE